jgi:hypothetical protein
MTNVPYNNRAYASNAPGAFYVIAASDFGVPAPAAPGLANVGSGGSLVSGTTAVAVAWITNEGVSLASASALIAQTGGSSGSNTISIPTLPAKANGVQEVIGWQVFSSNSSGAPAAVLLNAVSTSTTPAPSSIVTNQGTVLGFLVATTQVTLKVAGAGSAIPNYDQSGIQPGLPSIGAQSSVDYYAIVPNSGSQWKQQKSVVYMNSDGVDETLGIVLNKIDFVAPVYPGAANAPQGGPNPPSSAYTQVSVLPSAFMVLNGYLFEAVQAASASTAAAFIGLSAFNFSKGSTTADGSVSWLSRGKAGLARFHFSNVSSGANVPAARAYELMQL